MRVKTIFARTALGSVGILLTAIGWTAMAVPAGAVGTVAAYPPPPIGLSLSTGTTSPGSSIQVSGMGCPANSTVTISLADSTTVALGTTVANAQGNFSATVTIPLNATLGTDKVVATCGSVTMSSQLTIVAAATTTKTPLPFTGSDTRAPIFAGLGLIVVGSSAVLVSHKRRQRRHV